MSQSQINHVCPCANLCSLSYEQVYEFIKLDEVYYAGSHGMDIMGPSIQLDSYECKYRKQALDKQVQFKSLFHIFFKKN